MEVNKAGPETAFFFFWLKTQLSLEHVMQDERRCKMSSAVMVYAGVQKDEQSGLPPECDLKRLENGYMRVMAR